MWKSQKKLAKVKYDQQNVFFDLRKQFPNLYDIVRVPNKNTNQFTTQFWDYYNSKLENVFLPHPPFNFLNNSVVLAVLFTLLDNKRLVDSTTFLEKKIPKDRLRIILQEDYVGDPLIVNSEYLASFASILHSYHYIKFFDKTHLDINQIETVAEWGGGYGSQARIFKRLQPSSTHIIIDTPLMSCIQWLYLATILGNENVNLVQGNTHTIQTGKINLLPLTFIRQHEIHADLFLSTWALSESSKYSQDYVIDHNWLNSKHLLLAYSNNNTKENTYSDRVGKVAKEAGAIIEPIDFHIGNFYAFR